MLTKKSVHQRLPHKAQGILTFNCLEGKYREGHYLWRTSMTACGKPGRDKIARVPPPHLFTFALKNSSD